MNESVDLAIESIKVFDERPTDAPGWLACPIWPADAYGVIGSAHKVGKTWLTCDLVVSVASGGRWCDTWACDPRPVLVFLSEGGARKMQRRLRAVAAAKGRRAGRPAGTCLAAGSAYRRPTATRRARRGAR